MLRIEILHYENNIFDKRRGATNVTYRCQCIVHESIEEMLNKWKIFIDFLLYY